VNRSCLFLLLLIIIILNFFLLVLHSNLISQFFPTHDYSGVQTLMLLGKTFSLLLLGICFYAVVGLNLFSGFAPMPGEHANGSDRNVLGAACLMGQSAFHPFKDFIASIVTMYVMATTENFPTAIFPFYTCSCESTDLEGNTTVQWETNEFCAYRRAICVIFFLSFISLVFFCLCNSVLGVCYFWFEKVTKQNVITSSLHQRFSFICAFYYLETNGQVLPDDFADCVKYMRRVCPGIDGNEDGDSLFFRYLDKDNAGSLGTHSSNHKHLHSRWNWFDCKVVLL
jgi:hypothetical protein